MEKKEWKVPQLEVLNVSMTMKKKPHKPGKGSGSGSGSNPGSDPSIGFGS
ncbi:MULTISPECIES: paeninodin family lasso peptide [unclassified Paenibacillus]|nr:paeninodin family lasso peptide [Paenibacillus sp. 1011MAR3C5]